MQFRPSVTFVSLLYKTNKQILIRTLLQEKHTSQRHFVNPCNELTLCDVSAVTSCLAESENEAWSTGVNVINCTREEN